MYPAVLWLCVTVSEGQHVPICAMAVCYCVRGRACTQLCVTVSEGQHVPSCAMAVCHCVRGTACTQLCYGCVSLCQRDSMYPAVLWLCVTVSEGQHVPSCAMAVCYCVRGTACTQLCYGCVSLCQRDSMYPAALWLCVTVRGTACTQLCYGCVSLCHRDSMSPACLPVAVLPVAGDRPAPEVFAPVEVPDHRHLPEDDPALGHGEAGGGAQEVRTAPGSGEVIVTDLDGPGAKHLHHRLPVSGLRGGTESAASAKNTSTLQPRSLHPSPAAICVEDRFQHTHRPRSKKTAVKK